MRNVEGTTAPAAPRRCAHALAIDGHNVRLPHGRKHGERRRAHGAEAAVDQDRRPAPRGPPYEGADGGRRGQRRGGLCRAGRAPGSSRPACLRSSTRRPTAEALETIRGRRRHVAGRGDGLDSSGREAVCGQLAWIAGEDFFTSSADSGPKLITRIAVARVGREHGDDYTDYGDRDAPTPRDRLGRSRRTEDGRCERGTPIDASRCSRRTARQNSLDASRRPSTASGGEDRGRCVDYGTARAPRTCAPRST